MNDTNLGKTNNLIALALDARSECGLDFTDHNVSETLDVILGVGKVSFRMAQTTVAALETISRGTGDWLRREANSRRLSARELQRLVDFIGDTFTDSLDILMQHPSGLNRRYFMLLYEGGVTISLLTFRDGQSTTWHSHGDAEVGIRVLRGPIEEKYLVGSAVKRVVHEEGASFALGCPWIHRMGGVDFGDGDRFRASIHAYMGDIGGLEWAEIYEEDATSDLIFRQGQPVLKTVWRRGSTSAVMATG